MEEEEEELCAVWFHFHSHIVFVFRLLPDLQIGRSSQFDVHDWSTDDTEHFCRSLNVLRERHENYIKTSFLYLHFDFSSRNQVHHFTFFPTSDIFDAFLFKFSGKKKNRWLFFFRDVFVCRSRSEEDFLPGSRWNGKQTFLLHWIICFLQSYFISFNLGWSGRIKYISVIYSVELYWSQMLPTMFWHKEVCQFEVVYKSNCVFLSLWLLGEHQMIPQRARTERTWLNVTLIHLNTSWSHSTSSNYVLSLFYSKQETTSGKKITYCAFNLR